MSSRSGGVRQDKTTSGAEIMRATKATAFPTLPKRALAKANETPAQRVARIERDQSALARFRMQANVRAAQDERRRDAYGNATAFHTPRAVTLSRSIGERVDQLAEEHAQAMAAKLGVSLRTLSDYSIAHGNMPMAQVYAHFEQQSEGQRGRGRGAGATRTSRSGSSTGTRTRTPKGDSAASLQRQTLTAARAQLRDLNSKVNAANAEVTRAVNNPKDSQDFSRSYQVWQRAVEARDRFFNSLSPDVAAKVRGDGAAAGTIRSVGGSGTARVTVRPATYRGESGFTIRGTDTRGRSVSIFSTSRAEAERMRNQIKAGQEPTFDTERKGA